jgi:hypothetical protein
MHPCPVMRASIGWCWADEAILPLGNSSFQGDHSGAQQLGGHQGGMQASIEQESCQFLLSFASIVSAVDEFLQS